MIQLPYHFREIYCKNNLGLIRNLSDKNDGVCIAAFAVTLPLFDTVATDFLLLDQVIFFVVHDTFS